MTRNLASLIISRRALKRIFFIYLPLAASLWIGLYVTGAVIAKKPGWLFLGQIYEPRIPIAYSDKYNISFMGLEKLHPFDSGKYRRVFDALGLEQDKILEPGVADKVILLTSMTPEYLESLNSSWTMARITELGFLRFFPGNLTRETVLMPMAYQAGGSLLAAEAAFRRGWGINLGGGFHHASADSGSGFCAIPDISIIIKYMRWEMKIRRAMIVDFDAHQGNGYQKDFLGDKDIFIADMYNKDIFPHDEAAKAAIAVKTELPAYTSDKIYLEKAQAALDEAFSRFTPDIVIYVAGTDVMEGDKLGALRVSAEGIVRRDEMVFRKAFDAHVPIVMLLGGGYDKSEAPVIARSILNLNGKFNLWDSAASSPKR